MWILCTILALGHLSPPAAGDSITTWKGDDTGAYCAGASACDHDMNCSAEQMDDCVCKDGTLGKPGRDTTSTEYGSFKGYCNAGHIDGRAITTDERNRCLSCTRRVCDGHEGPTCKNTRCGKDVCAISQFGQSNTKVMDSCPTNHQKNVAKCCLWDDCHCVTGRNLDVSGHAMAELGCGGTCTQGVSWHDGTCSGKPASTNTTSNGCSNTNVDVKPPIGSDGIDHPCSDQADWGKCSEPWMKGYCCKSCANPPKPQSNTCTNTQSDTPPPSSPQYKCSDQAVWGKCSEPWMKGYCCKSCANPPKPQSNTCTNTQFDTPPPSSPQYKCSDQAVWGKCSEPWMKGYCCKSCANPPKPQSNTCTNTQSDTPPPSSPQYKCSDQAVWGKCSEPWMKGYCCKSCANPPKPQSNTCTNTQSDTPPPSSPQYKCSDQADWGKCSEPWMKGYCCKSCAKH
ncbi:hypothetical protein PRIPAC_91599 [Pristionchus pacificus]|uniref:Uncharacterized protein n=1 Tax=Pristionchus pacificus TaxID=54126 RepID=A0A454XRJ3_PRIPA|nr:hypothetical protein PRIPAC_91599 [Pristionchus pacificus]|eukprot:PDM77576.1 hypothetical protein PRIPAC_34443 [Pristionchus pacificus]